MTMRNLARASAAGLLASGVLALAATPALAAAGTDFGIELKGTSVQLGSGQKPATVTITNHGTTTPEYVGVLFDASGLDESKVEIDLGGCTFENGIADCSLNAESIPGPGRTTETDIPLRLKEGVSDSGDAILGKLKVTVVVEGDENAKNDSKTTEVQVVGSGGDLRVLAWDVTRITEEGYTDEALAPGESSYTEAWIGNVGDRAIEGLKIDVELPEHVTFAEREEGCDYNAANTKVTCVLDGFVLTSPGNESEGVPSAVNGWFAVTVSEDAKGPVALKDGKWTATSLGLVNTNKRKAQQTQSVPEYLKTDAKKKDQLETDPSDNSDTFAVLVAGPDGGVGGGEPGGPGLPVTGPIAATVAGAGVAVVAIGAVLFMMSRRRRVGFVTPADGQ